MKCGTQNVFGSKAKGESKSLFIPDGRANRASVVEAVEALAEIEGKASDDRGLVLIQGTDDTVGEKRKGCDELLFLLGKRCRFRTGEGIGLIQNAAGTGIGILSIGAGIAIEIKCLGPIEVHVLNAICGKAVEDHSTDTYVAGDLILIGKAGILFLDDGSRLFNRLGKEIVKKNDVTRSGGNLFTVDAEGSVGNVNQLILPIIAHQTDDLEPLSKVQALAGAGNIHTLIKMIFLFAPEGCRNVAGGIERGAVSFQDKARRHMILLQIHKACTVVDL